MKIIIKPVLNIVAIVFLLIMILFIWGYPHHRLEEKPGININKEEKEKQEYIPDTTDPILLNRF